METGTVKWFNQSKMMGFITPDKGGADLFVHSSYFQDDVKKEGDKVTYERVDGRKGPEARNVRERRK